MDGSDIVEIYSAANSIEAYAMTNALKAAGIKARVADEHIHGLMPLCEPMTPKVWVLRKDEAHARELLKQWKVHANTADASVDSE